MLQTIAHRIVMTSMTLPFMCALPAVSQTINENAKILPEDGRVNDEFGRSVAISEYAVIVGSIFDDDNGPASGSAYLFDTNTGQQIAKLLPDDGSSSDLFGGSVAISGNTAIIGARWDDDNGEDSGSAYLFDTNTGQQIAKLLPKDGGRSDYFGQSVSINGSMALVGAPEDDDNGGRSGSAYLFDTITGQQIAKLLPNDGETSDLFGYSVAISGTMALVGAFNDDDNGDRSGSAYLFDTTSGKQIAKLLPNDGAATDQFGVSVAISGTTAVVGAPGDDDHGSSSGSAYLFNATTGQQIAKLLPNDGAQTDQFGSSVSINCTTVVVGARLDDDNTTNSGSAYAFDITTALQITKLLSSDGSPTETFGSSVAISGTTAVVGAPGDDDNGGSSGSAYVFTLPCLLDLTREGDLNFLDISAYLAAFRNQDPIADFVPDGNFNFLDVFVFLTEFENGCP